jgi:hypothetical protein
MQHAKQEERKDKSMLCFGGHNRSLLRQQPRVMHHSSSRELSCAAANLLSAYQQCSTVMFPTCIATHSNHSPAVSPSDRVMLTDMPTKAACAPAILLAVSCCCASRSALLQLPETQNVARHACGHNYSESCNCCCPARSVLLQLSDKVQHCMR